MKIKIKTPDEIEKMRHAGKAAASVLNMISSYVESGITTLELNDICHEYIVGKLKSIPAPLNYKGFPKSICTSVNDEVCHGIPKKDVVLKDGDIVNVDVTVIVDGYHGDTSKTFLIGKNNEARRLIIASEKCMQVGISKVKPGEHFGEIGCAIEQYASALGYSVVREYGGHGIGIGFHEEPSIAHFAAQNMGPVMKPGMIFTVEPMVNAGSRYIDHLDDGWTVITKDGELSAQHEHTIMVTNDGYEILTQV